MNLTPENSKLTAGNIDRLKLKQLKKFHFTEFELHRLSSLPTITLVDYLHTLGSIVDLLTTRHLDKNNLIDPRLLVVYTQFKHNSQGDLIKVSFLGIITGIGSDVHEVAIYPLYPPDPFNLYHSLGQTDLVSPIFPPIQPPTR